MIGKILAVVGIAGVGFTIADKYNVFGVNPTEKWFWERPPFVAAPPAATQLNLQQIAMMQAQARQRVIAAEEEARRHQSKYVVTAVNQPYVSQPYVRPAPYPY